MSSKGRYTEMRGDEVFACEGSDDLKEVLIYIFECGRHPRWDSVVRFVSEREMSKIASAFIELFNSI